MRALVIGTRGSQLALWQARHVAALLRALPGSPAILERIVETEGDRLGDVPIGEVGETGVFVRRIEQALLAGDVDLAVHSLKDLPTEQPEGLRIVAVLERHDPRDTLLSTEGFRLEDLPPGSSVATGSPRRRCQLLHVRPDLKVVGVRGNVDTRVRALAEGRWTALVLALAGIDRLGIRGVASRPIDASVCVPAVGQGALALECRADDAQASALAAALDHGPSRAAAIAERAFLRRLGGGCMAPATAYARVDGRRLAVEALVGDPEGRSLLLERESGEIADAETMGSRLAERLWVAGAEGILHDARTGPTG